MTSEVTITYRTDADVQFRVRIEPTPDGSEWTLTKERKIGTTWNRLTRTTVSDVSIESHDAVVL